MNNRAVISTAAAPSAIGPYSQAVKVGNTVWISGQIPLDPETMELVSGGIEAETRQVFANLQAIANAAGGSLDNSVKINISLTDLGTSRRATQGRANRNRSNFSALTHSRFNAATAARQDNHREN